MSTTQGFDDLWVKALEKYFDSTKRTDSEKVLLQALKSPEDLGKQLEADHTNFSTFRDKHRKLTGKLKAVIKPFIVLSSIASSAVSLSHFAPASTILGAVLFLVNAANGVSDAFDWIDQLFEKLRDFAIRLDEYCKGDISAHLGIKVVQILECLLEILARSEKTMKDGRWREYIAVIFLGKDEKIKASFDKLAKLFENEHQLVSAISFATNQRIDKRIEEIGKVTKEALAATSRAENDVDVIQRRQQNQLREKILDWISSNDFPAKQSDLTASREEGTGDWFLKDPKFETWIRRSKQTLFCYGMPGAGKTMMAAIAIDHLSRTIQNDEIGVAYIYCNYKVRVNRDGTSLLAAILRQLAQGRPSIPESILRMHESHSKRGDRPQVGDICSALQSILQDYSSVYLIVDALDECLDEKGTRPSLLAKIRDLQQGANADLHLMVTSRSGSDIVEKLKELPKLEVRASDEDVKRFIAGHMDQLPEVIQCNGELKNLVMNVIAEAVDGMFLLARLYVDSLLDKDTKKEVTRALEKISKGSKKEPRKLYDNAYGEALERIGRQLPGREKRAKKVLSWITYAERQLTVRELCHALAIELGELDEADGNIATTCADLIVEELDMDNILSIKNIVSVCAGLVIVEEGSNIIRLVHYTTQEYFERTRERWFPRSQLKIASTCLIYLSFNTFRSGSCPNDQEFESRLEKDVFFDYASRYWGQHARTVQEQVYDLASPFLQDMTWVSSAVQTMSISEYKYRGYSQHFPRQLTGLHITASFGLLYFLERLLSEISRNIDVAADSKDKEGRTPLSWAAEQGYEAVVKLLVERDDVAADSKDQGGRTPLSRAAEQGYEAVVELLVERDDVAADSKDQRGRKPLSWAATGGHEAVVKLLVERDDVAADSKDRWGRTPLSRAAEQGHEAVVKLLVERDDVAADLKDQRGRKPLSWAATGGHEAVVKLLVERDDVAADSKDQEGQTPLSWAAEEGHEAVVKLLVERDDVAADSKDQEGRTPLSWAAARGHEAVVKLLVERDDVAADLKDRWGRTPLSRAAAQGHEAVVKLLVERDDVAADSKDQEGRTPLSWAAARGHEAVVKLLVERDDVAADSKDRWGRKPLSWAATGGHEAVVKLLVERDDVTADSEDQWGRTPLSLAAARGHEAVVKLLVKRDDVAADLKDQRGRTPLSWAAARGHEAVVKLLVKRDDVAADSKDQRGRTPLSWAAARGHEAVVKLLVKRDDVAADSKDQEGRTPLSWAAARGHEAVVKLLVKRDDVAADSKDQEGRTPLS